VEVRRRDGGELAFEWSAPGATGTSPGAAQLTKLEEWIRCLRDRSEAAEAPARSAEPISRDVHEQLRALGYVDD
jgi:hypothetical protein